PETQNTTDCRALHRQTRPNIPQAGFPPHRATALRPGALPPAWRPFVIHMHYRVLQCITLNPLTPDVAPELADPDKLLSYECITQTSTQPIFNKIALEIA